jgi:ferredoxin
MPKKFHLNPKPAPGRFATPGATGIIEGDGCLNCSNCVKKLCVYSVYDKRAYDERQMFDTADSLCKNCYRCVQGCYGRILSKSRNPEFRFMGDEYWTPEIIATNQGQAETAKIPVSGGGYGGRFSGPGFDSMWTDMSEIVRPTRDGIHGREYISTAMELGRLPVRIDEARQEADIPPRIEVSVPILFDLLPFGDHPPVLLALARAAEEVNSLAIFPADAMSGDLLASARHLVPFLGEEEPERLGSLLGRLRMAQVGFAAGATERIARLKAINPEVVVSVRMPLNRAAGESAEKLVRAGAEVLHFLADGKGREVEAHSPRFVTEMIREVHLHLVGQGLRDGVTLVFGGGIGLAEHVAKAIICGADAVSIERPLLIALECRMCGQCLRGRFCPVELERISPQWGRQRLVNLMAAWHGQLLEVLGAMGMRDIRRLRGEVGRAIFLDEIERDTFGRIFGERIKTEKGETNVLAT